MPKHMTRLERGYAVMARMRGITIAEIAEAFDRGDRTIAQLFKRYNLVGPKRGAQKERNNHDPILRAIL